MVGAAEATADADIIVQAAGLSYSYAKSPSKQVVAGHTTD